MKVRDHLKYCRFKYENSLNPTKFVLGEVVTVIDKVGGEFGRVGVVINIHDDGDIRTDMFGNYHVDGLRLSTLDEVKDKRPELLADLDVKQYADSIKIYHVYETDDDEADDRLITGTIKDVRKWAKDLWKYNDVPNGMIKEILNIDIEEDYYNHIDNDAYLLTALRKMGYVVTVGCVVPLEDFELID